MRRVLALWCLCSTGCLIGLQPGFGESDTDVASGTGSGGESTSTGPTTSASVTTTEDPGESSSSTTDGDTETGGETGENPIDPPGYRPRACGFDIDHDGIAGEPEDCTVCDGVTENPFGDAHAQRVKYVDCDAGVDRGDCRDPSSPCASVGHAIQGLWETAENGYQLVVCVRGTCPGDSITLPNGWPEAATHPKQGTQARDFDYPAKPTLLAGWDSDGDGEYPPVDADDVADFDLDASTSGTLLYVNGSDGYIDRSHDLEVAHLRILGGADGSKHLLGATLQDGPFERIHLHDLEIRGLHRGQSANVDRAMVSLATNDYMGSAGQARFLAFENIDVHALGGYMFAENADNQIYENGPIRIQNLTVRWEGCTIDVCDSGAVPAFWRSVGWFENVEIIDNVFLGNTDTWMFPFTGGDPDDYSDPATAIIVGECNREFDIRNNEIDGFAIGVRVEANSSLNPCDARSVSGVRIDGNLFRASGYEPLANATVPFYVTDAADNITVDLHVGDVRIVNNAVIAPHGWRACAGVRVAGPDAGPIAFDHNTCFGALADPSLGTGHFWVRVPRDGLPTVDQIFVRNSLFAGANPGDVAMLVTPAPAGWQADGNVFDPAAMFKWSGPVGDLDAWRAMSGGDAASRSCVPEVVAPDDVHLAGEDTCAADGGLDLVEVPLDIDGDGRPMGPSTDVGADERR